MKAFIKTLAISLSSLTLFCTFSIAQSSGNSSSRSVERIAELSRSIERASLRGSDTRAAAKERFGLMRSLAETDPAAVLSAAISPDALSRASDASRKYLETREMIEGELEVMAECEEHAGRIEYFVKQGDKRLPLYLAGEPDGQFVTGKKISVDAVKLDDILVASSDSLKSTDPEIFTQSALTNTTGEKRVLVILVNFQDNTAQPYTTAHAQNVVFNLGSSFVQENSYGRTWLAGDVHGWYTIPMNTSCETATIGNYARQAAANSGVNLAAYEHFVYGFPSNSSCGFSGRSSVGGSPSHLWINSNLMGLPVFGHEFGHSLGLFHSQSLDCGSATLGGNCTSNEIGDTFDIMGISKSIHLNAYQKERLGWLNASGAPSVQTVSTSGSYWVDAYAASGNTVKALKILKSVDPVTGARTWYYLEHRTPVGFDSSLGIYGVENGMIVRLGSDSYGAETYLLDMTPETPSWYDAFISRGNSYTDTSTGMSFTVVSADGSGAIVNVTIPAQACTRGNPSLSLTPGQSSWLLPGTTFAYTATVTNNNGSGCPAETFDLAGSVPSGWAISYSGSNVNVVSGGSASALVYVSSPSSVADGTYNFGLTVVSGSLSGSATASYKVVSRLGVSATPGAPKYSRSQTAKVTSLVTVAGAPVAGATVTFTLRRPNGTTVLYSVESGSDGRAVFSYKFDRKLDPTGTYSVSVLAETKDYSGQASTSFVVSK